MISFENLNYDFNIKHKRAIKRWIKKVVKRYNYQLGDITYIFTSDPEILNINREYLSHDYFTDIITFNYNEDNTISGDIFISIDRVKENSKEYSSSFEQELYRVIIHGILHLLGFNDKTSEEEQQMRKLEDSCLTLLNLKF